MPLYDMVVVTKINIGRQRLLDLYKTTAMQIIGSRGVVRSINNMTTRPLPYPIRAHGVKYRDGLFWSMRFDCHPGHLKNFGKAMQRDLRVLRHTIVRVTSSFDETCTSK